MMVFLVIKSDVRSDRPGQEPKKVVMCGPSKRSLVRDRLQASPSGLQYLPTIMRQLSTSSLCEKGHFKRSDLSYLIFRRISLHLSTSCAVSAQKWSKALMNFSIGNQSSRLAQGTR